MQYARGNSFNIKIIRNRRQNFTAKIGSIISETQLIETGANEWTGTSLGLISGCMCFLLDSCNVWDLVVLLFNRVLRSLTFIIYVSFSLLISMTIGWGIDKFHSTILTLGLCVSYEDPHLFIPTITHSKLLNPDSQMAAMGLLEKPRFYFSNIHQENLCHRALSIFTMCIFKL